MSDYTRVTVQGTLNRADLVLPSDEPLAALLPEVLTLLDEPAQQARPLTLVTVLGEQLSTSLSLAEQSVRQGSIVRLVRVDEAPPPPEVADITQLAGESVATRHDRWRRSWAVLAAGSAAVMLAWLIGGQLLATGTDRTWLLGASAALAVAAIGLARRGGSGAAAVVTALAVGLIGMPMRTFAPSEPWGWVAWLGASAALVAVVALVGYRDRGLALGAGCGAALVALAAGLGLSGLAPLVSAGVVALVGALALGVLPGVAMTASGLTGLDDRVIEGASVRRADAEQAIEATHRGLNWTCLTVAAGTAAAGFVLATSSDPWALGLAIAVAVVVTLRTRVLPLAPQRLALFGAAIAIGGGLAATGLGTSPTWTLLALFALAALLVALTGLRLSDNLLARLGRLGNLVEMLAVLAAVPLLLGLMGVFRDLLAAF
ncbi:MAG: hypothetical protein IPL41_13420 [Micropruina sp.]|nr:hypothetical protein [Micropruina sp.]